MKLSVEFGQRIFENVRIEDETLSPHSPNLYVKAGSSTMHQLYALLSSCIIRIDHIRTRQELILGDSTDGIVSLTMTDGKHIEFAGHGAIYSPAVRQVKGKTVKGGEMIIPTDSLTLCEVYHYSIWWSLLFWIGAAVGILALIFSNMPRPFKPGE
jgi:hypothetical protein